MKIGVALGGGGVVGRAWECGVLQGLASSAGFDAREATVLVGTSAGSIVSAIIDGGASPDALVAFERERLTRTEAWTGWALDAQSIIDVFSLWSGAERMTPEEARKIGEKAMGANCVEEESYLELYSDRLNDRRWGRGDVRIAAVNCTTGERVFWTRDSDVPLRRAVAASCAIPAFFPPVTIGKDRYMDGGVWSGTNADVLLDAGVDSALIIAPMTAETFLADATRRALDRELDSLGAAGIAVEAIAPEVGAFGTQLMDPSAVAPALDRGLADGEAAGEAVRRLMK